MDKSTLMLVMFTLMQGLWKSLFYPSCTAFPDFNYEIKNNVEAILGQRNERLLSKILMHSIKV